MRVVSGVALVALSLVLGSAAALADGDPEKGRQSFNKCKACHSLEEGKNLIGPSLYGIVGRKAGTVPKFSYSKGMAELGVTWDAETMRKYLHNPKAMVPNTKMIFAGIPKDSEIDDLLAYLKEATKPK
jgi:cytochrome c